MSRNSYFQFKQFQVQQDRCAMKITMDACFFGATINFRNATTVLDIGTGTGLLALMAAQRSNAEIDAVEIEKEAAAQATENIAHSPWSPRIHVHHSSIQNFACHSSKRYDTIICNPPFYTQQHQSSQQEKQLAWHTVSLSRYDLMKSVKSLLTEAGRFHLILPTMEAGQFLTWLEQEACGFSLVEQIELKSFVNKPPKRMFLTLQKEQCPCCSKTIILYEQPGQLTRQAKDIMRDFYLS